MKKNRLIIIRGPSGSGKTTVANQLFKQSEARTVIINQDYYRFIFNPTGGGSKPNAQVIHKMIEHNCITALHEGYDVILEGILSIESYGDILDRIIDAHKGSSFIFYFDIPFAETAKRHQTRSESSDFSVDEMKSWYDLSCRSNHQVEQLLPKSLTAAQSVAFIRHSAPMHNKLIL